MVDFITYWNHWLFGLWKGSSFCIWHNARFPITLILLSSTVIIFNEFTLLKNPEFHLWQRIFSHSPSPRSLPPADENGCQPCSRWLKLPVVEPFWSNEPKSALQPHLKLVTAASHVHAFWEGDSSMEHRCGRTWRWWGHGPRKTNYTSSEKMDLLV